MFQENCGKRGMLAFKRLPALVPVLALLGMGLLFVAGCGGGGGSGSSGSTGSISALSLPDRIQLTQVDDGSSAAASLYQAASLYRAAYNDAGTDYTNAEKHSWVKDINALDMVNDILGVVKDTAYSHFVNAGPYKALVRQVGDEQQSQSGDSTTSTTSEQLMEIIVDVTRASNSDPMHLKVWVYQDDGPGGSPMLIRGYFTVTESVSAEYPFGALTAYFKGVALNSDGSETGTELFNMSMSVSAEDGHVVIEYVEDGGQGSEDEYHRKVRVVANSDASEGNAYVYNQESQHDGDSSSLPDPTIMQIAYNSDYFKVSQEGQDPMIFNKNQLKHRVFRYQLFDAVTGAAVTRNSGFPIKTSDNKNGYVGYYGLWTACGASIADGDTVTDMDGNAYTVFRAAGKLTKHTRASMQLSDLNGVELAKSTCNESGCQDTIVAWDSTSETFITLGYRNQSTNGQISYYGSGNPAYHQAVTFEQWEGAWCEGLKAYMRLGTLYFNPDTNQPATPTNASMVYYHTEETVDPNTAENMTLYTWSFTLDPPISQGDIDGAQAAESAYWQPDNQSQKTYYFDAATMMLYADAGHTTPVILSDDLDLSGTNYEYGYNIGPLTTASYTAQEAWQANEAETFYTWNTGTDQWNQFTSLIDANGDFVSFQAPITFVYTHSTDNDINFAGTGTESPFDGKKFRIEYDGFSVNIPWACDNNGEWQPQINILDGTLMGPSNEYVIKGIEEGLIMKRINNPDVLAGITITDYVTDGVNAPTLTYDSDATALVGDVPDAELQVIKGSIIE